MTMVKKKTVRINYPEICVVHPLDDAPEAKCTTEGLEPIRMTTGARISLLALRGYLCGDGGDDRLPRMEYFHEKTMRHREGYP